MSNKPLSHTEKMYLENEEFNKKNQEEVIIPKAPNWKAIAFRKENGYSRTMGKLMEKYNCKTVEEYRVIRKKHQKEGNIGPKKEKKVNPDIMSVWCLDKKEWRSFRIANVISAKAKDENSI